MVEVEVEESVEMSNEDLVKQIVTSMSVEVAKQIEAIRTELSAQIAEVKTTQVDVKASTKAKPEVTRGFKHKRENDTHTKNSK
jgi:hypothetical protein